MQNNLMKINTKKNSSIKNKAFKKKLSPSRSQKLKFNLGNIVRNSRKDQNLTQFQLAHKSGVSIPMIQIIESGKANPSLKVTESVLKVLGLSLQIQKNN